MKKCLLRQLCKVSFELDKRPKIYNNRELKLLNHDIDRIQRLSQLSLWLIVQSIYILKML